MGFVFGHIREKARIYPVGKRIISSRPPYPRCRASAYYGQISTLFERAGNFARDECPLRGEGQGIKPSLIKY